MSGNSGDSFAEMQYKKMSDEELQNTLRCETFSAGALDNRQIEMILKEMERRGINNPTRSPEDAWVEFEKDYSGKDSCYNDCVPASSSCAKMTEANKPHRRHRIKRKTMVLAAVITFMVASLLTVQAAGVDIFGAIARWTTELFSFGKTEETKGLVVDGRWPEIDLDANQQFVSLQKALDYYGVTEVVAPEWLPAGFTQDEISVVANGVWLAFFAEYSNTAEQVIIINYNSYAPAPASYYEKSGSFLERFEVNGNRYDIFENTNNYVVAWITPHFECCISAPTDVADVESLKNILLSMQ